MSALIEPPVAPATPALASVPATPSPRIVPNGGLPESAKITVNRNRYTVFNPDRNNVL